MFNRCLVCSDFFGWYCGNIHTYSDGESIAEDMSGRSTKRKQRNSPESTDKQVNKMRKSGQSPPHMDVTSNPGKKNKTAPSEEVQTRKNKRKQHTEQPPIAKQKRPRKLTRPDQERRLRGASPHDGWQALTNGGDILIILSKENTDKRQALPKIVASILKEDAKIISKMPQEDLKFQDLDDTNTGWHPNSLTKGTWRWLWDIARSNKITSWGL